MRVAVGNHLSRALAYQQRTLREAMTAAGYSMPREAAVQIVAELHGSGHAIIATSPEAQDAYYRAKWMDQAAPDSPQAGD
jgi:hypothetical protein